MQFGANFNSIYSINACRQWLDGQMLAIFFWTPVFPPSSQSQSKKEIWGFSFNFQSMFQPIIERKITINVYQSNHKFQNLLLRHLFSAMGFPSKGCVPFLLQSQATDGQMNESVQ